MDCKNCGAPLNDNAGFCSYCGARRIDERISTKFLFQEIMDKVLNVDNKLLKTFIHLFTKPEQVINGYIGGIRKRYYNPFSYLLISITISGLYIYFLKDILIENFTVVDSENPFQNSEFTSSFMDIFVEYQAFFTVMNIPVYGFLSWLVFYNRRVYNFFEHNVIYLYAASQATVFSFILVFPFYFIDKELTAMTSMLTSILTMVYFAYVLIRLFKLTLGQFIIKALFFSFLGAVFFIIIGILMNVFLMLHMGTDEYLKQFAPDRIKNQKDSIKEEPRDSLPEKKKEVSFYEASSKLNCFS